MEITYNRKTDTVRAPEPSEKQPKLHKENFLRLMYEEPIQNRRSENTTLDCDKSRAYKMRENVQISIN